ncbi:MAG TPA: hypothetical protein VF508_11300 [Pyrinomonadaceae bacterium]
MRRFLFASAILLALCAAAHARRQQAQPAARMLDEFGRVAFSDMLARLDNFAVELQNNPGADGVIAVYPEMSDRLPGWFVRRAYWAKGYLTKGRGLGPGRVRVVNAGFEKETRFVLWVVPAGAASPVAPLDWGAALAREKNPVLFDRTVFENYPRVAEEGEYEDYTDPKDRHEPFVSALRADPAARGYLVGYATRRNRRGSDRALAAREKLALMKLHALGADRIVAVGGGLRTHRTLEDWLVPPGAPLPRPTPDARPVRRKRR